MKAKWVDKNGIEKQVYFGVVITKLQNNKYTWGFGEKSLSECKNEILKEFGGKTITPSYIP